VIFDLKTLACYDNFTSFYDQIANGYVVGLGVEFSSTFHCNLDAPDAAIIAPDSAPWAYDLPRGA
jgi:hypothetical protein